MKNSEDAVARVLAGLRDVEAPTGMERRIAMALERTAGGAQRTGRRRGWPLAPLSSNARTSFAAGVAFAGLLAAVLWMPKPHRSAPVPVVSQGVERPPLATLSPAPPLPPRRAGGPLRTVRDVQANAVSFSDALALTEMCAPSQLAPPLPLTEQEKFLLRVARRQDPAEMAMLNPEMRGKQELRANVEFQEFFEPARPVEERRSTNSTDKKGDTQ